VLHGPGEGHQSRDPASPHHFLYQAASWLAPQGGTELVELPGAHMAYLTEPAAVADAVRRLLRQRS
jgi:pimeloyl-ACP methyl ester carboxylesterase